MHGLSCAHHDLPFGTILIVTNEKNNKTVRVVVNDRMPELYRKRNRIIDLSLGAGKVIDMINDGVVEVKIQIVRSEN
jgi:rare lipoprotein A